MVVLTLADCNLTICVDNMKATTLYVVENVMEETMAATVTVVRVWVEQISRAQA